MTKSRRGFTIVEVLVVISIIGILATITFMGFGRYQADTRDSARASQAKIISESLEKYFEQNGEYPSCPALTGTATAVTTSVLPGVEPQTLVTPQAPAGTTNSIQCADLTSTSQPDFFAYIGDNSAACLSGSACITYQLKYEQETTGQIVTIDSRHQTGLVVSGAPTLSVTPDSTNGFTQLNSTWTAIAGSNSYDLQRSTSSDFSTGLVTSNTTGTTLASTGLSYNTTYYFRIRANSTISTGPWSGVTIAATWGLVTPTVNAVATSTTSFNVNWSAVPHAVTYTIQLSSDGTSWSTGWQSTGLTASPKAFPGATPGWKYYVRMQAYNGSYASSWSGTASTALPIDTPVVSAVVNSSTTFTSSWGAIAGATSYNVQCSGDNATWGSGCAASTTGLSFGWGPTWQGRPLYFRTQAVGESTIGNWSASVGATTWIDTPAAPTYLSPGSFQSNVNAVVNYAAYCPANTWPVNTTFRSQDWYGVNWGPHPWGYNDSWQNANGVNKSVQYWGHYQCQTPYVTSAMSPESYNVITVTP